MNHRRRHQDNVAVRPGAILKRTMQRISLKKNYFLLTCMALGLLLVSYHFTTISSGVAGAEEAECVPKRNILFLKTHKTAGSTIQNIFLRYAKKHDLLLVLPLKGNYLGHPFHFEPQMVPRLRKGHRYNILAHHARFRYDTMRRVLPDDAAFVTVLRDPVTLFESLYSYYSLNATFAMDLDEFAASNASTHLEHHNQRFYDKIGRNQMAFDLGLTRFAFDDSDAVLRAARRLDRQFHLVMIAELMDESLVLLRDLLCWDTDDVVAFRHNARADHSRLAGLRPATVAGLRAWNGADQLLYDYFRERLDGHVERFGRDRMAREVDRLRRRARQWYEFCVAQETHGTELDAKFRAYNAHVLGFRLHDGVLRNDTCEDMAKAELPFTSELQQRQHDLLAVAATVPTHVLLDDDGSGLKRIFQRYYHHHHRT